MPGGLPSPANDASSPPPSLSPNAFIGFIMAVAARVGEDREGHHVRTRPAQPLERWEKCEGWRGSERRTMLGHGFGSKMEMQGGCQAKLEREERCSFQLPQGSSFPISAVC